MVTSQPDEHVMDFCAECACDLFLWLLCVLQLYNEEIIDLLDTMRDPDIRVSRRFYVIHYWKKKTKQKTTI